MKYSALVGFTVCYKGNQLYKTLGHVNSQLGESHFKLEIAACKIYPKKQS
jgi:hypothetical protein